MTPLFSIITITYNAAPTLPPTMQSVAAQTCGDYEHLIIDGASKDDTLAIAQRYATDKTAIFSEPDRGLYDAMNKGLNRARGRYLIFLNAGDTFHSPTTLQTIADTARRNNFPGVIYGQTQLVDADRRRIADRHLTAPARLTADSFKNGMLVCHQAFVARRDIAPAYDLSYRLSADYDWCIRTLRQSTRNILIPEIIIGYLSEGLTTANRAASLKERYKIMCRHYGTLPTLLRHLKFLPRFIINKLKGGR